MMYILQQYRIYEDTGNLENTHNNKICVEIVQWWLHHAHGRILAANPNHWGFNRLSLWVKNWSRLCCHEWCCSWLSTWRIPRSKTFWGWNRFLGWHVSSRWRWLLLVKRNLNLEFFVGTAWEVACLGEAENGKYVNLWNWNKCKRSTTHSWNTQRYLFVQ